MRTSRIVFFVVLVASPGCTVLGSYGFDGYYLKADAGNSNGEAASNADSPVTPSNDAPSTDGDNGCQQLEQCCQTFEGGSLKTTCDSFVQMNSSACQMVYASYLSSGYCTGAPSCMQLMQCCGDLPGALGDAGIEACNMWAQMNNAYSCEELLTNYQGMGYCNGHEGGLSDHCYTLSMCCPSLPSSDQMKCVGDVGMNVDGICKNDLASFADAGCP